MRIRRATENDAEALLKIYAPYVEHTAITFEYEVPSVEEFRSRIRHTLEKYPYLVAEEDGELLGYAYVGPFHDRPAYDWAVETSIYVDERNIHKGVGGKLHDALEQYWHPVSSGNRSWKSVHFHPSPVPQRSFLYISAYY